MSTTLTQDEAQRRHQALDDAMSHIRRAAAAVRAAGYKCYDNGREAALFKAQQQLLTVLGELLDLRP